MQIEATVQSPLPQRVVEMQQLESIPPGSPDSDAAFGSTNGDAKVPPNGPENENGDESGKITRDDENSIDSSVEPPKENSSDPAASALPFANEPLDSQPEKKKRNRGGSRKKAAKKGKQPSKIVKLRIANFEPAPLFEKLEFQGSIECFWLRVQIREFLLRFDKLCRIPTRYTSVLNDITAPWNDQLYKAVIVALLRLFSFDQTWLIPQAKDILIMAEDTAPDSSELWAILAEFLMQVDPYASKADALTGEHYRLELIRRLLALTTGTDTIRLTVTNDHEQLQQLKKESADQVKLLQTQYTAKLDALKQNPETFEEKKANAERLTAERIFKTEQTIYNQLRKYNLRTAPIGRDNFNNVYWILQQKAKDQWGSSVICEMRVFPDMEAAMVLSEKDEPTQIDEAAELDTGESLDPNGISEVEQKPKKRRRYIIKKKKIASEASDPQLCYVTGQENVLKLAAWIRGQVGVSKEALANEIENMAYYCFMD